MEASQRVAVCSWGRESTRTKVGRDGWLHRARSRKRRHYRCRLPPTAYLTALPTKTVKPTRRRQTRHFTQLDQVTQLVAARDADPDLGFMARLLALCSLPRTNPKNRHEFKRVNGPYTLYMVAGGGNKLPYGTLPRLLLAWVCTEAVRTQSPELILGDSLSEFMRKVGIYSTSGDKHTRLRNQMRRLFGCTVSLMYENTRGEATLNAPIARLTRSTGGASANRTRALWESRIELGEDFFNEIISCPIPIDMNTLRAMKRSPLGLDLYLWLTYRTFALKRPLLLTWRQLYRQFGADPADGEFAVQKSLSGRKPSEVGLMPLAHLQLGPGTPGGSSRVPPPATM